MKYIIFTIISLLSLNSFGASKAIEHAYEVGEITLEYSDVSHTGWIRPSNCTHCKKGLYTFTSDILVYKNNQPVPLTTLLKEYLSSNQLTLIVSMEDETVTRIYYAIGE